MAAFRVAHRYAKGLLMFAKEADKTEIVYNEMISLNKTIEKSPDLTMFLKSPVINSKRKISAVKEVFSQFSQTSKVFISLLVKHGRENIIKEISKQYIALYDQENEILTAEIISASVLDEKTINNILSKVNKEEKDHNKIKVINRIDPSLIGGFILNVDNYQYDSSIKSKITKLKKEFHKNDYTAKY